MHNVVKVKQGDGERMVFPIQTSRIHGQWCKGQLECSLNCLW